MLEYKKIEKFLSLRHQCFSYGVDEIVIRLKENEAYAEYMFIDFDNHEVKNMSINNFAAQNRYDKCVLVSSENLLPLALSYFWNFSFISTVINKTESLNSVTEWLLCVNGGRKLKCDLLHEKYLTYSELYFLEQYLAGENIYTISATLNKKQKTIYNYRKSIAVKMGLKRLENLFK